MIVSLLQHLLSVIFPVSPGVERMGAVPTRELTTVALGQPFALLENTILRSVRELFLKISCKTRVQVVAGSRVFGPG